MCLFAAKSASCDAVRLASILCIDQGAVQSHPVASTTGDALYLGTRPKANPDDVVEKGQCPARRTDPTFPHYIIQLTHAPCAAARKTRLSSLDEEVHEQDQRTKSSANFSSYSRTQHAYATLNSGR